MTNRPRILANATVDELRPHLWEVTVQGHGPHDKRRTYTIDAKSDNDAAQEGLARFVAEMENLTDGRDGAGW